MWEEVQQKLQFDKTHKKSAQWELEPEKQIKANSVELEEIKLPTIKDIFKETNLEDFNPNF